MIIGSFTYDEEMDAFQGDILTLNFAIGRVSFMPVKKGGDKEPDYRITAPTAGSELIELGAGWKRTSEKGQEFVSVTLDGPLMATPLNAALFRDGDKAALVWSRQKGKAKSDTAKKAA